MDDLTPLLNKKKFNILFSKLHKERSTPTNINDEGFVSSLAFLHVVCSTFAVPLIIYTLQKEFRIVFLSLFYFCFVESYG